MEEHFSEIAVRKILVTFASNMRRKIATCQNLLLSMQPRLCGNILFIYFAWYNSMKSNETDTSRSVIE